MEQAPIPTVFEIQSLLFFEVTMWNQSHDCLILQKARWTYLSMTVWISNQPFVKTGTKQISGYQFVSSNQDLYPNHLKYNSIRAPEKQVFLKANFLDPFFQLPSLHSGFHQSSSHPLRVQRNVILRAWDAFREPQNARFFCFLWR